MKRILTMILGLTVAAACAQNAHAQRPRNNPGLPKVDFHIGQISPLGQGIAIQVANRGFDVSPKNGVRVTVYDAQSRQLLTTKTLKLPAMRPNTNRRVIFVPPQTGKPIMVRAKVDPGNQVQESNERNNEIATRI